MSSPGDTSRKAWTGQDPLKAVQPVGKARRFRLLLPTIIEKIQRGVEHAEIIKALAHQGLELTQGTYFNYLNRYRATGGSSAQEASGEVEPAEPPKVSPPPPFAVTQTGAASGRPRTFDYDPRGIDPDLLK